MPVRAEGHSLGLDATVFERYDRQQGSPKSHNSRKHGRPSHHPVLAVLLKAHFLRSGNCGPGRGVVEFLEAAQALWGQRQTIRLVKADSGCFDAKLLKFLEQHCLPYVVVTRLTKWVRREAQRTQDWTELDADYAAGQFRLKLDGWNTRRRLVVIHERIRQTRASLGRKLIEVPGYTFRIFVTSRQDVPEQIWRDYNRRADMENRIAEQKHDSNADRACLKQFHATEAAFRSVVLLFNLLREFQGAAGPTSYSEPPAIRTQVATCGVILGRPARRLVLHMGQGGDGLTARHPHWTASWSGKSQLRRCWLRPYSTEQFPPRLPLPYSYVIQFGGGQLRNSGLLLDPPLSTSNSPGPSPRRPKASVSSSRKFIAPSSRFPTASGRGCSGGSPP